MVAPFAALLILGGAAAYTAHRSGALQRAAMRMSAAAAAAGVSSSSSSSHHQYAATDNPDGNLGETASSSQQQQEMLRPYVQYEGGWAQPMVRREALLMLGFGEHDTPEEKEIIKRHRVMMAKFHADVGGPDIVCQKLNEARDILLPK